jgi:glycosyltransferase involved in cell wall biosynthesis
LAPGINGRRQIWKRLLIKINGRDIFLQRKLKGLEVFDIIFFNTIASFKIIPLLPSIKATYIAWLHEQPFSIEAFYGQLCNKKNLSVFTQLLTVSTFTKEYLQSVHGIAESKIVVAHPFIDISLLTNHKAAGTEKDNDAPFVIGGCGLQDWRKGPDLFLQIAKAFVEKYPEVKVRFIWVGNDGGLTPGLKYEVEKLGLQDIIQFTGAQKDVAPWFNKFDIFLLTSREDPFPLVVLEAFAMNKPVICFDNIGDITSLVGTISENVVSYGNINAMVARSTYYMDHPDALKADGQKVNDSIQTLDVETGAAGLFNKMRHQI